MLFRSAVRGQLAEYEFAAEHDEFDERGIDIMELGKHYTDALSALTERKAYSKSSCAQMIAEQSERAERAESALAAANAEAEALREMIDKLEVYMVNGNPKFAVFGFPAAPDFFETASAAIDASRKGG